MTGFHIHSESEFRHITCFQFFSCVMYLPRGSVVDLLVNKSEGILYNILR